MRRTECVWNSNKYQNGVSVPVALPSRLLRSAATCTPSSSAYGAGNRPKGVAADEVSTSAGRIIQILGVTL